MERSKPGVIKGKFLYLSPEQLSQDRIDHRADLFALGTMLYEVATGKSPFYKATTEAVIYAIRAEDPPPPQLARRDFPPELSRIVMKCLVKDRARRYQQATEIQRDLEAFMRSAYPTDTQELSAYITQLFASEGSSGEKRAAPSAPPPPASQTPPPTPSTASSAGGGRKDATVPLPQAGGKASVLVPAQKRTTGDRDVPVPSDAAPTAHASPEEVARAQQLAAVRSGIMAALPHRKSMRHELGQKRRGTVTMRGNEQRRSSSSDRNESVDESMAKSTPSRAAMGALPPPSMGSPAVGSRESQSFTSPEGDPLEAQPSDPSDNKMTEAIPAPPMRRRRTPANPAISADTEANERIDDDEEEGGFHRQHPPRAARRAGPAATAAAATRQDPAPAGGGGHLLRGGAGAGHPAADALLGPLDPGARGRPGTGPVRRGPGSGRPAHPGVGRADGSTGRGGKERLGPLRRADGDGDPARRPALRRGPVVPHPARPLHHRIPLPGPQRAHQHRGERRRTGRSDTQVVPIKCGAGR